MDYLSAEPDWLCSASLTSLPPTQPSSLHPVPPLSLCILYSYYPYYIYSTECYMQTLGSSGNICYYSWVAGGFGIFFSLSLFFMQVWQGPWGGGRGLNGARVGGNCVRHSPALPASKKPFHPCS